MDTLRALLPVCLWALVTSGTATAAPMTGGTLQIHEATLLASGARELRNETGNLRIEQSIVTALGWTQTVTDDETLRIEATLNATGEPIPARPVVPALPTPALLALATMLMATAFGLGRTSAQRRLATSSGDGPGGELQ